LEAGLAKAIGSVDDLGRPVVRIEVPDRGDFLAVVDTGFNRSLLLLATEAHALGFAITEDAERVELATTMRDRVFRARGTIRWLGRLMRVVALVSVEPTPINRQDTARALIGTELLADCVLLVDFVTRLVAIENQH
jgi:hypothetical protein